MDEPSKKKHRAPQSGAKTLKKSKSEKSVTSHNPKGFAVQHTTKAAKKVRKTLDRETKKYRLPNVSAEVSSDFSPPLVVGIVGPPRCGKSTLLRDLIRHFGRQLVPSITGPITVVVGKKYRMTLIECDCNINSMIDIAKIADLILLIVNVQNGLEMYHFEFINMLQVHGMPRVIPILNHLDQFKESSSARAMRKKIKQRLWNDLSAKIFMLSRFMQKKVYHRRQGETDKKGMDGTYMPAEIQRLARLMVVKSPRPSDWRTGHPYMLVDRVEDVTNPRILTEDEKADRVICLYGWVRGASIEASFSHPLVHIPGLGDFSIAECTRQQDPCPTPAQIMRAGTSTEEAIEIKLKRRLSEGERKLYAPMSSIGGVLFDRDATYIDLGGSHHLGGGRLTSGRTVVVGAAEAELAEARNLLSAADQCLDERLEHDHRVQLLSDAPLLEPSSNVLSSILDSSDEKTTSEDDTDSVDTYNDREEEGADVLRIFEDTTFPDNARKSMEVDSNDGESGNLLKFKKSVHFDSGHRDMKNAFENLGWEETTASRKNWKHIIYDTAEDEVPKSADTPDLTGEMFRISTTMDAHFRQIGADDVTIPQQTSVPIDWTVSVGLIANRFTTGEWSASEDAGKLLEADAKAQRTIEALKAQKMAKAAGSRIQYKPGEKSTSDISGISNSDEEEVEDIGSIDEKGGDSNASAKDDEDDDPTKGFEKKLLLPTKRERILEKRRRHKELFDRLYEAAQRGSGGNQNEPANAFYDKIVAKMEAQKQLNREVLTKLPPGIRETVEGVTPGSYVRLKIAGVPYQFMANFDPRQPLVVGGLVKGEEAKAFIQARFQAHRWLKRVLKSNDPITVSVGWRRYQTVGVFSKEEHNFRKRYLKYALAHEHCNITFYGPVVPAKTGVVAFINSTWREQTEASTSLKYRIAGTGSVTDCNESFQIMKKLKLVGHPFKLFSKTAFIRDMFNSELEVAKMIGSKIQTASKVRGLVKGALTGSSFKPGDFRATFEASIKMADIVFMRTFVPIELVAFYNPIPNLLLTSTPNEMQWRMLRTVGELRWETGTKAEVKEDSKYKEVQRVPYVPAPLTVPTKLIAALPFADKPKVSKKELRTQRFLHDEVRRARRAGVPAPVSVATEVDEIPDPVGHAHERAQLIQRLRQLHAAYQDRERKKMVSRTLQYKAKRAAENKALEMRNKKRRKEFFARHGGVKKQSGDGKV